MVDIFKHSDYSTQIRIDIKDKIRDNLDKTLYKIKKADPSRTFKFLECYQSVFS